MLNENYYTVKRWCRETESNRRHKDFQSSALPPELSRQKYEQHRTGKSTTCQTIFMRKQLTYQYVATHTCAPLYIKVNNMKLYSVLFGTLVATLLHCSHASSAPVAPLSITTHLETCYALRCLWTALYGEENPLECLIQNYEQAITVLASIQKNIQRKRSPQTPPLLASIQEQLAEIQARAAELINQYQLSTPLPPVDSSSLTPPPPTSYTATPLITSTPDSSQAATQQLLMLLQQLPQQPYMYSQQPHTELKEQLLLFGIGVLVLACLTYGIKYTLSTNTKNLKKHLHSINQACTKPHENGRNCGITAQMECLANRVASTRR